METDELRTRLSAAENTMRKLHRRNMKLQEDMTRITLSTADSQREPEPIAERPATAGETQPAASANDIASADEQALYLLQQKEKELQAMRDYTAQLHDRLGSVAEMQRVQHSDHEKAAAAERAESANAEYRERYMRARHEYRQLLRSRVGSVKKSSVVAQAREQNVLMGQLDAALQEEANLHRLESQRLNEELYLQEKRECDWHVERRLLESKLSTMESEMKQRDDIDGEIENKMVHLFGRLKQLEDANLQLEQRNESLLERLGDDEPGPSTSGASRSIAAHEPLQTALAGSARSPLKCGPPPPPPDES